ncbi:MAG: hypothetical protein KF729_11685 [Sandaracinaceae bacterium]|nr:hypothetical protein [Sandaracinaceae bacterium]
MKHVGVVILCVGVAIAAAYGARLSPPMRAQMVARGEAAMRAAATRAARDAYCAALAGELDAAPDRVRALAAEDECELPGAEAAASAEAATGANVAAICSARGASGSTYDAVVTEARATLERRAQAPTDGLAVSTRELRARWLAAARAEVEPAARAALLQPVAPEARLTSWLAESGLLFALGLALVVVGAVLGRVAARREAHAAPARPAGEAPAARDLGALLDDLHALVAALAEEAARASAPSDADFDALKDRIHEVVLEKVEPIVDAAPRVQAKYGLARFADVFGPLSSGERYLNRAWSALVDRHWEEATRSLARAAADLEHARAALSEASSG